MDFKLLIMKVITGRSIPCGFRTAAVYTHYTVGCLLVSLLINIFPAVQTGSSLNIQLFPLWEKMTLIFVSFIFKESAILVKKVLPLQRVDRFTTVCKI